MILNFHQVIFNSFIETRFYLKTRTKKNGSASCLHDKGKKKQRGTFGCWGKRSNQCQN